MYVCVQTLLLSQELIRLSFSHRRSSWKVLKNSNQLETVSLHLQKQLTAHLITFLCVKDLNDIDFDLKVDQFLQFIKPLHQMTLHIF